MAPRARRIALRLASPARSASRWAWPETTRRVGFVDVVVVGPWMICGSSSRILRAIARPVRTPAPNRNRERSFIAVSPESMVKRQAYLGGRGPVGRLGELRSGVAQL